MKPSVRHPNLYPSRDPEMVDLSNKIGKFIEYWGFKSVQGKIWCYLYLSQRPLSSIELGKLIKISPALVTQSVQVLLKYEVIQRAEKGLNGVLCYEANPNVTKPIMNVLMEREMKLLEEIRISSKKLKSASRKATSSGYTLNSERLESLEQMIAFAGLSLNMWVQLLNSEIKRNE